MAGSLKDRSLYFELKDKSIRTDGAAWVEPQGAVVLFDDFLGDTLDADLWLATDTVGAGTGGSAFAISSTAGDPVPAHGGWISGTTHNVDASAEELASMAATTVGNFRPSRAGNGLLVYETRISLPVITTILVNAGLTDDETEGAALAMSLSGATWTTTASDAALWVFDTNATTDVFNGQTVDTDVDGTHVAGSAPVAATAMKLRIEIDTGASAANFYQDGAFVGTVAASVSDDRTYIPYLAVASTTTTSMALEADYLFCASAR